LRPANHPTTSVYAGSLTQGQLEFLQARRDLVGHVDHRPHGGAGHHGQPGTVYADTQDRGVTHVRE
jgi:hypothetical protein